jgi:hypothetical protein
MIPQTSPAPTRRRANARALHMIEWERSDSGPHIDDRNGAGMDAL